MRTARPGDHLRQEESGDIEGMVWKLHYPGAVLVVNAYDAHSCSLYGAIVVPVQFETASEQLFGLGDSVGRTGPRAIAQSHRTHATDLWRVGLRYLAVGGGNEGSAISTVLAMGSIGYPEQVARIL